jgi:hypothetical protein
VLKWFELLEPKGYFKDMSFDKKKYPVLAEMIMSAESPYPYMMGVWKGSYQEAYKAAMAALKAVERAVDGNEFSLDSALQELKRIESPESVEAKAKEMAQKYLGQ